MNKLLVFALCCTSIGLTGYSFKERWDGTFVYREAYWNRVSRLSVFCDSIKTTDVQEKAAEPWKLDPREFNCGCRIDFESHTRDLRVQYDCYSEKHNKHINIDYKLGITEYVSSSYWGDGK